MDNNNTLEITDLTVAYDNKPVLWDIDLNIQKGVLMAIVGPNGAGKTTLIKAIQGLVPTAAGRVRVFGKNYSENRRLVGYVPQRGSVDWDFPTSVADVYKMKPKKKTRKKQGHRQQLTRVLIDDIIIN